MRAPTVAIVGTRRSTRYGRRIAFDLAELLSDAGILVISGLARGIDGMAQRGALAGASGSTVAVVGCGVDRAYPAEHRDLQQTISSCGAVISESPLGAAPQAWRFPARNRIIAGLADAVIVVESAEQGGSMHTVEEALARDRVVMAVPGPIGSSASVGCNRLIGEGAIPLVELVDAVRVAQSAATSLEPVSAVRPSPCTCGLGQLSPDASTESQVGTSEDRGPIGPARPILATGSLAFAVDPPNAVAATLSDRPLSLDEISIMLGADPLAVAPILYSLAAHGRAEETRGWWCASVESRR
jgi:DNA protecting protein DprA